MSCGFFYENIITIIIKERKNKNYDKKNSVNNAGTGAKTVKK